MNNDNKIEKVKRKKEFAKKTGGCTFCPYHRGENYTRKPRTDKYKNKR